jgi:hypothetical protein
MSVRAIRGIDMKRDWEAEWEAMTIDELFELRELMQDVLSERLKAKKAEIELRLQKLDRRSSDNGPKSDQ